MFSATSIQFPPCALADASVAGDGASAMRSLLFTTVGRHDVIDEHWQIRLEQLGGLRRDVLIVADGTDDARRHMLDAMSCHTIVNDTPVGATLCYLQAFAWMVAKRYDFIVVANAHELPSRPELERLLLPMRNSAVDATTLIRPRARVRRTLSIARALVRSVLRRTGHAADQRALCRAFRTTAIRHWITTGMSYAARGVRIDRYIDAQIASDTRIRHVDVIRYRELPTVAALSVPSVDALHAEPNSR